MVRRGESARQRHSRVGFVLPLMIFVILGFDLPIALMLGWSIRDPFPTLRHYAYLLATPVYLRVIGNTMRVGLITTLACILIGYPLAYWMQGLSSKARMVALSLVILPFWISILIRTYAWIVILGNAGLVNRVLIESGLIGAPVSFLYNEFGVTVGTVNVLLPFFVLPLYASMTRVDRRLLQAAESMGASRRTIFWRIFFPQTRSAVAAGAVLVFILTLGFYITPAVLGGGRVSMVANMLDTLINQVPRWELAAAISTLLMAVVIGLYVMSRRLRLQGAR
jgi:putative spermidine/putrescine transport system permease protein